MTNEMFDVMCKRIMAQGYTLEELAQDIDSYVKKKKISSEDVLGYLFKRKSMPVQVEKALCKIVNMEYRRTGIPKPENKEGRELLSVARGTKKGIIRKLSIMHGPEYTNEIERKIDVIISAAYKYGLEVARNE